jgi:hypothetical protein
MITEQERSALDELACRCLEGDSKAWVELYGQTREALWTAVQRCLAWYRVNERPAPEDVLQDIWVLLLQESGGPTGLLHTTARHGAHLRPSLVQLVRRVIGHELRAGFRRRQREVVSARSEVQFAVTSEADELALLAEFLETLPPTLRAECVAHLTGDAEDKEGGQPAQWTRNQRRRRLRQKLHEFFAD